MQPKAGSQVTRWVLLTLVVGLLVFVRYSSQRQEEELRALMTRGQPTIARVIGTSYSSRKHWAHFSYTVGGIEYQSTVEADKVPVIGVIPLVYRPEKPSDHWIGPPLTEQVVREKLREGRVVYFLPAVAALSFVANEYQLRRRRQGLPRGVPTVSFTRWAFTLSLYAILIGSALAADSSQTFVKAFGPQPLGLPNQVFVVALLTILYLPAVWFMPHVAALVIRSNPAGEFRTKWQANDAMRELIERDPAMARSNRIAMIGVCYFVALMVAWIVYASYRGI